MNFKSFDSVATLNIPTNLVMGRGASHQVGEEAQRLGLKDVLVVTDWHLSRVGLAGQVTDDLDRAGIRGHVFAEVTPDPTVDNVIGGLEIFRQYSCTGVVAIGGGSSIDAAKGVAIMSTNGGSIFDYQGYHRVPNQGAPLIAIPTTAGTGSEVTKVSVITDMQKNVKMLILDSHLLPRTALVDYELTLTMPAELTASVGLDSLTHAIEAYVSVRANLLTDLFALEAARLIGRNLCMAFFHPSDRAAREAMMRGATLAGIAFSNASVALVHGMSRPLGALFHVPHGLSNAMLLPAVTAYSIRGVPARYAQVARHAGLASSPDDTLACGELVRRLKELNQRLQVRSPREYGIKAQDYESRLEKMAQDALDSGSPGFNPRVPTHDEIVEIYRQAYS